MGKRDRNFKTSNADFLGVISGRRYYSPVLERWVSRDPNIRTREVLQGVENATVIREYPDYGKGPCVLVLQHDAQERPVHVVWGIEKGTETPAVIVTAYRPDPAQWDSDFIRRRKR